MTDATDGSATQLTADAGTPAAATGGNGEGSPGAATDPFAGLDAGTREWIGKAGVKDVASLASKARNAESLIGKMVQVPGTDAKPEDWSKFYGRIGRPEKPDGYDFKLPDGLPENLPYDDAFAAKFRDLSHTSGLTARQAAAVHDFYVGEMASSFKAQGEAVAARAAAATESLEKAFGGARDSEPFKLAVTLASKAITGLGGKDLLDALGQAGIIGDDGVVLSAPIAEAFWKVGKAMFAEDGLERGTGQSTSDNPFRDGPGKGNQTLQMRMIAADRAQAVRLIEEAGHKPADFGIAA